MTETDPEIQRARAEVENTRANLGETLEAIKDKLDPHVMAAQAKQTAQDVTADVLDRARESTIGRAQDAVGGAVHATRQVGENFMDTIKENPLPAALIGIGLGWMYLNSRQR